MQINLIAAIGNQGQLGLDGVIPWREPTDLQWFKELTMGDSVVVGSKTYENLPSLPGRELFVMTRADTASSLLERVECMTPANSTVWIAGGAKTYAIFMPLIQRFFISRIDYDGPADVYMPKLPW